MTDIYQGTLAGVLIHGHMVADLGAVEPAPRLLAEREPRRARRPSSKALLPLRMALRLALRPSRRAIAAVGALLLLLALACDDGAAPLPPADVVAAVVVAPEERALVVGETATLTATPRDASGRALPGRPVGWASSDTAVAAVSSAGRVAARRPGTAVVSATSEGKVGRAVVIVEPAVPAPVDRIDVTPAPLVLEVGRTRQLTAVVRDATGNVLTGRTVTWRTDAPATATVSATGLVTAVGPGYATIIAASEGKTFGVAVTVSPPEMPEYRLLLVNGSPVPRTLFTTIETGADGVARTVRRDAYDGYLRLGDGRYEHVVAYWAYREGAPAEQGAYVDRGTFLYDMLDGGIVFHPSDGAPAFRGAVIDGTLVVARRLVAGTPELTFLHRVP